MSIKPVPCAEVNAATVILAALAGAPLLVSMNDDELVYVQIGGAWFWAHDVLSEWAIEAIAASVAAMPSNDRKSRKSASRTRVPFSGRILFR
jgi:hypothetical protein